MGPLLYLTLCSVRNRVRVRLRRLKQPRYLIGMIVGLAYFWMVFGMPRMSRQRFAPAASSAESGVRSPFELGGAAFLFVLCATAWIPAGRKRPALNFTQSDVQFLFPAPFTRRELIRYKLLRSQTGVLIGSAFMTLVFRPWTIASLMFFVGMALFMTILNLHLTGISLSRESLGSHGMAGLARQWLPLAVVIGAAIILAVTVILDWPTLSTLRGADLLAEFWRLATTGASGIVMWPFRAVVRVPAAETQAEFLRALPWALLILALNYVWVIRSDARFEEASAELAEKIARIRKGRPSAPKPRSATQTPFRLSLEGRPEMAIFWKNLILLGRYASLRTLLRFVPIFLFIAAFARVGGSGGAGAAFAGVCAVVFGVTILLGPQLARNDLRQDLANLALIKTWPLNGATLVRGEVMAPAALLTAIAWCSAIGGLALGRGNRIESSVIVAALVIAPGIILLQLLAQNAIAVMWPTWVVTNANRVRGIDVMGQRMIMMFGLLLVLVVAVVPAALVAVLVGLALSALTGKFLIIIPALAAALVLFGEAFLASHAIGKLLDRTDVSAIDTAE
jgi:ABC-2 type transport system permease protein